MTARPGLRIRKKIEVWKNITSSAWELFKANGYEATTLEQIAEAANIHKQTVLRHFRSKEDIALAYHRRMLDEFAAGLSSRGNVRVIDFWRAHVRRAAKLVSDSNGMTGTLQLIHDNPKIFAHFLALERRYEDLLHRAFAEEAGKKPDKDLDSLMLASFLVGANNSVGRRLLGSGKLQNLEKACIAVVDVAEAKLLGSPSKGSEQVTSLKTVPRARSSSKVA